MITWDNAQTISQDLAQDTTSATLTKLKRFMNIGYKNILSEFGRQGIEQTQTGSTVASQQSYGLPPDFLFTKTVKITIGSTDYVLDEVQSQQEWDIIDANSTINDNPQFFFIRQGFGFQGSELLIFPTPSSAGNTLTVVYEATDKDLAYDKYITGTVSLTSGDATVTGSGTTFTANMVGRYFQLTGENGDGFFYRVASRASDTSIELENVYEGNTIAGEAYQIAEAFNLPEEMQVLPVYYGLMHYFAMKNDKDRQRDYFALYNNGMTVAKRNHATRTRNSIIGKRRGYIMGQVYPSHFPGSVSE